MFRNKAFWQVFLMPGSLAGWIFVISGFICNFDSSLKLIWLIVSGIWMIVHPLEIFISYKIGKQRKISTPVIIIKTILFGFTWWLPLKLRILER